MAGWLANVSFCICVAWGLGQTYRICLNLLQKRQHSWRDFSNGLNSPMGQPTLWSLLISPSFSSSSLSSQLPESGGLLIFKLWIADSGCPFGQLSSGLVCGQTSQLLLLGPSLPLLDCSPLPEKSQCPDHLGVLVSKYHPTETGTIPVWWVSCTHGQNIWREAYAITYHSPKYLLKLAIL